MDYNTSGLLLFTNDGSLTFKITHPKHKIEKIYIAKIIGIPNKQSIKKFENGLIIDNKKTAKSKFEVIKNDQKFSLVKITITEGRNRQVRKMCQSINHPVISLERIAIGKLSLENLKQGQYRFLTKSEVKYLKML